MSILREAGKYAIVGVAGFSLYQLTVDLVYQTGSFVNNCFEWFIVKRIQKEYDILGILGSGKTSKIYKVRRKRDGEILALKVLSKCNIYVLESNAFDNERFILSRANHPNIINLIGSDSKLMYQQLELELAPDGSLLSYVHKHGPLSELLVVRMLCQLLDAMIYLFNKLILLHRDIKPENVLIFRIPYTYSGIVDHYYKSIQQENNLVFKLCDFGFSGINSDNCGTKYYTHPDVFEGLQKHTIASELWSLGIVAHYALFGTNPYYKYSQVEDKSMFMNRICMERRNWKRLGPKLRNFFKICLNRTNDILIDDVIQLYNDLSEERIP